MRKIVLVPVLALAACSSQAEESPAVEQTQAAEALKAGQWEITSEIGKVASQDNGTPVLKEGEKIVVSQCVGQSEVEKPQAAVFAGMKDATCSYDNFYMSAGRINATLSCTQPGLAGKVLSSARGTFTADSFALDSDFETYLTSDGDARAPVKLTGRWTGECTAPAAEDKA